MEAIQRYGKLYLAIIACFALAASLVAAAVNQVQPVSGDAAPLVIYLDPGHGGEDGGAVSVTGVQESQLNLEISLRLRELLHLCGVQTIMTRDGDYATYDDGCDTIARKKVSDLKNRVAMLQNRPGAILLSIHQNQFPEAKYYGAQVFYNAAPQSQALATDIQAALRTGLDVENHRECKRADGVYLMEQIQNTAVLVECGFLSNREEEALLRSEAYQKKLTCAISAGLIEFFVRQTLL